MSNKVRLLELDALRGIAAFFVALFHYTTKYNEIFKTDLLGFAEFPYGHYGVQLFFIISGFVIFLTVNKIKTGLEFVYKRFLRLYPTFWLCMLITFSFTTLTGLPRFERTFSEVLINITMVPGILGTRAIDGVYWSLLPELLFYALMFFLFKLKLLNKINLICIIWLTLALIFVRIFPHNHLSLLFNLNYAFLFVGGIYFYRLWSNGRYSPINYILLLYCLFTCYMTKSHEEFYVTLLCFAIFYLFSIGKLEFLGHIKPLLFLGKISYSFYLLHQFIGLTIIYYLNQLGIENYFLLLMTPLLLTGSISWVITYYFERFVRTSFPRDVPDRLYKLI